MADSLLREVDEALRADRAGAFWQKNKRVIIAFIIALIVATAANSFWQHYKKQRGGEMLASLMANQQLLNDGKPEDAAKGFKAIADSASGEFKDLALVWESRALFASGKKLESVEPLKLAVADGNGLWNDIACLRLAGIDAKAATPCLTATTKSPLASTRAEWSAANLWANGERDAALAAVEKMLANKDLPPDSRDRLTQWRGVIGAKAEAKAATVPAKVVEEKTTEETAPAESTEE